LRPLDHFSNRIDVELNDISILALGPDICQFYDVILS